MNEVMITETGEIMLKQIHERIFKGILISENKLEELQEALEVIDVESGSILLTADKNNDDKTIESVRRISIALRKLNEILNPDIV